MLLGSRRSSSDCSPSQPAMSKRRQPRAGVIACALISAVSHLSQLIISVRQAAGMTKEQLKEFEATLQQKLRDITSKMSGMDTNPEYGFSWADTSTSTFD
jgi:hypothetical protein